MSTQVDVFENASGSTDEAEHLIAERADLEAHLTDEIARLCRMRAPRGGGTCRITYDVKPAWWWRYKMMTWAHRNESTGTHAGDLLRGLRMALRDWSNAELVQFLGELHVSNIAASQRGRIA